MTEGKHLPGGNSMTESKHLPGGDNTSKEQKQETSPPGIHAGGGARLGMVVSQAKPKNARKTFLRLLKYLQPFKYQLLAVVFAAILGTAFSVLSPKLLGQATTIIFDGMMAGLNGDPNAGIDFARIGQILVLLIGLYIASSVFIYIEQFLMAKAAQKIVYSMRSDISKKLSLLPLKYFDTNTHGEILSRMTNDMDTVGTTLQQSISQIITSIVTIGGIFIIMLSISGWMTLITLVTLPLTFIITARIARISQKNFAKQQRELGRLNGHIEEMFGSHVIVRAFGNEQRSISHFQKINEELNEAGWRAQFVSGLIMPFIGFLNNIGYVLIAIVGAIFVAQGRIVIGDLQAFIQYSRQFTQPVIQTASIANVIQSTIAAAERIFELLDEDEETPDHPQAVVEFNPKGEVRFEDVHFSYSTDSALIEDMNIGLTAGQTIAIVGPTGAGKTTLVNLLMRFYDVNAGRITIDGMDIRDIKRNTLRLQFGMVLQDTWVFKGTIRDNIAYGKEGATEKEVVQAATAAHADHFIRTLPDGYDTVLNEEATNISQGQKQLLTIARALLADPKILILDEATSSVDTRTELLIQKGMTELMKGRTSFVIAHRLSTIRDANIILVMNEGSVIEAGSHQQLLEKNGFYAELYKSQFSHGAYPEAV